MASTTQKLPAHIEAPDVPGIGSREWLSYFEDEEDGAYDQRGVNTSCPDCHGVGIGCCVSADIRYMR